MSLKPIRSFLTDRLKEIDSDFTALDNGFETTSVGVDNFNKRFHIFYGNVTTTASNQNTTSDIVSAVVTLFFSGSRNSTDELDNALDIANSFRINCLRRSKYANQDFIKNVVSQSIEATPLDTNDNQIMIKLTFNISVIFGTGLNLNC